jgi:purine-cytosine permease-like protein
MIQRIQSVWLLLAALFSAGTFMFDVLTVKYMFNNEEIKTGIQLLEHPNYLLIAIAIFTVALPAIAIFLFRNRKQQKWMAVFCIVLHIAFIALYIVTKDSATVIHKPPVHTNAYAFGGFLPVFAIIFLVLAIKGINKDEKLVKSLDRLR